MFIVLELQTEAKTTTIQSFVFTEESTAEQKYHQILSYAAVSTVDIHSAVIMNEDGVVLKNESYNHMLNEETV